MSRGMLLPSEQADICAKAAMYQGMSNTAIVGGLVFAGVGVLLIVFGTIASTKRKKDKVDSNRNERAYCRYCGLPPAKAWWFVTRY
jgi:hypothetical protein